MAQTIQIEQPNTVSQDDFFTRTNCPRCNRQLKSRTMSWFTDEVICLTCSDEETDLKLALSNRGKDPASYEGCGKVPQI